MKTAVIYARYSCYGQTEQSIEGQVRECREYARQNNIVIVDSYIDRAMTGTNDNRTDFQRMMKDSAKKAWEMILVYKLDRFSRNKYEMAIHRKTLRDNGVKLVSVKENIPDTPEGIILESLLEGMAEYYSVELAQKVMRGQRETRIKGNYAGGGVPYGYKVEKINGERKFVVKEDEAAIVRRIFEEYASGKIGRDIIDGLTADGILARDGKPFGRQALYGMLQNERYTGVYRHKTDGAFYNTFPRIVPQPLFETVRKICEENKLGKHSTENPYLLRGKIHCGYCGATIRGDSGTSTNGEVVHYYSCANRKRVKNKCKKRTIRKEDLEKLVIDITIRALDEPENVNLLVDKIFEINEERLKTCTSLESLREEEGECQKSINNLMRAVEQGIVTSSTQMRLMELEDQLEAIRVKLRAEESKIRLNLSKSEIIKFINKAIRKEPAHMIRMLIKKIVLYDDKIEIYYNTTERIRPDEDSHQVFLFYSEQFVYENKSWWFTMKGGESTAMEVNLLI